MTGCREASVESGWVIPPMVPARKGVGAGLVSIRGLLRPAGARR
jgi:hypothetical protein